MGLLVSSAARVGARVRSLRQLFTDTTYLIDNYQREYAWSQDDVQILIDDLWGGFEGLNGRPAETFFLGPFVYVQHDEASRWLVDGQQRFTTLHLILLHLHRIAQQYDEPDTAAKLYSLVYGYTKHNRPRRFRIDINERRPALEALRDGKRFTITGKTLSVRNLWQRGEQLRDLLDERINSENCAQFVDWMLDQVVMVAITAPDRPSGYSIFESMNDRGARLTPVDLLKSHLMSKVGDAENEANELNEKWRTMLAELTAAGNDDPDTPRAFLKAALVARWAHPADDHDAAMIDTALHLWVKDNPTRLGVDGRGGYFRFMDTLIKLAKHYAMFLRAAHHVDHKNGVQAIYFNHANGLNNQMALLLAAVDPGDSVSEARSKASLAANFLDLKFVTQTLADEPTDARRFQDMINDVIPQLRASRTMVEVRTILTQHLPNADPFVEVPTFGMRGTNYRQVKYLLARLTAYVEAGCKIDIGAEHYLDSPYPFQVEHVFANHPERYGAEIPDPVTFRSLRARLGVLLLLPSSDNASFNDAPYGEKVGYYSRHNRLAAILDPKNQRRNPSVHNFVTKNGLGNLFHNFGDHPKMTVVVETRGRLYQELCRQVWSTEAVGLPIPPPEVQPEAQAQLEETPPSPVHAPATEVATIAKKAAGPAKASTGTPTQISKLVRAKVVSPETKLQGTHRGTTYTAHVDADGRIRLASGDHYRKPDDAARIAVGTTLGGMAFWHVNGPDGQLVSLKDIFAQAQKNGQLATAKPGRR